MFPETELRENTQLTNESRLNLCSYFLLCRNLMEIKPGKQEFTLLTFWFWSVFLVFKKKSKIQYMFRNQTPHCSHWIAPLWSRTAAQRMVRYHRPNVYTAHSAEMCGICAPGRSVRHRVHSWVYGKCPVRFKKRVRVTVYFLEDKCMWLWPQEVPSAGYAAQ